MKPTRCVWVCGCKVLWALCLLIALAIVTHRAASAAEGGGLPMLYTNEQYISDVSAKSRLDVTDLKSVLSFVLGQLPDRVHVVPTENYYYFYFFHGGVKYAGNLRFDVGLRDRGVVAFTYFRDTTLWQSDPKDYHAMLGPEHGVTVERAAPLTYRVSFKDRSVVFQLNDLSEVRPPDGVLATGETFLGPVADESGMRFFLVFDQALKVFHYVLDESVPMRDELIAVPGLTRFRIGRRTGFAFHRDTGRNRWLLVGVHALNIDQNNYFDGPFDQLPDNFIEGDELKQALVQVNPEIADRIDRLGISPDGERRELIAPYLEYESIEHLAEFEPCVLEGAKSPLYLCFDDPPDENTE